MKISVVTTERNEVATINEFIQGILNQSYPVDELVICDGGSTDGTIEIIEREASKNSRVKLVVKSGNISVGRNEAIRKSKNEIIAVTDVGTIADKNWLRYIVEPFEKDYTAMVVGGFFKIKPSTLFENVSATQMLSDHDNIDPDTWLPSSRSIAFKKEAWIKAGGYPELLPFAGEDTLFDLNLKKAGYKFAFAPKAVVYWRPRPNLEEFFKQYYKYAIGDGLGLIHWPNYFRKMLVYVVGLGLLISGFWLGTGILLILYLLRRGRRVFRKYRSVEAWLISPVVTVTNDLADIFGFIKGLTLR